LAGFDAFATQFSDWVGHVNPPEYASWLDKHLPVTVERALDAGCGPGKFAAYLSSKASLVVAVDISRAMLELTQSLSLEQQALNIQPLLADLNTQFLQPASFDIVASDCTLHATQPEQSIPALRTLVKPGGWLVVRDLVTQNPARARSWAWQITRTLRRAPGYIRNFGIQETFHLLGFELSPAWIRHNSTTRHLSPEDFTTLYQKHLPGCHFMDQGWAMTALWQADRENAASDKIPLISDSSYA